jgi:TolA-binding protein
MKVRRWKVRRLLYPVISLLAVAALRLRLVWSRPLDEISVQQGGTTSRMRADLTSMLNDLQQQIARLHNEINETQQRIGQLNQRLDRIAPRPGTGAGFTAAPDTSAPSAEVASGLDLDHLFNQAREDHVRGRYELAYQGFRTVYERDEAGSYREGALYWMAESLWKGQRERQALEMYRRTLREYPEGALHCATLLKIGLLQDELLDLEGRDDTWETLIRECPESNEALRARELLNP